MYCVMLTCTYEVKYCDLFFFLRVTKFGLMYGMELVMNGFE